jgi:ABC-type glycerol-3-phosphate transport system substrate-binding protein
MRFILLVALLLFAGCTSPAQNKTNTITVWHWMTDRDPAFQELAKRYQEKTGIKVNFELYAPSDAYSQKVRGAAQGATLPDIFGVLGQKRDFASFIKAGHILDLTAYMDDGFGAWRNKFFAKALAVNEFIEGNIYDVRPGIYGVPLDIMTIQMVYNKTLLKQLGFNPQLAPQTFTQWLEMGKRIKEAKLQGLVSGWGDAWMIDCFANNYAFNIMGKDKVLATIRGEVAYTDPDWIKVFTLFKQMKDSGIVSDGILTMENKTAEQLFSNQRAVFAFNGSWCVNVYKSMNPSLDYAAMLPPKFSDKFPMSIWGGAGSSFMVNAKSKNKEEAVKFLKWLTYVDQQAYLAEMTLNLPANKEAMGKISANLAQFANNIELTTHPNVWDVSEFPLVLENLDRGLQSIVLGEKTPEQVASQVQKIKQRELKKKR